MTYAEAIALAHYRADRAACAAGEQLNTTEPVGYNCGTSTIRRDVREIGFTLSQVADIGLVTLADIKGDVIQAYRRLVTEGA